MIRRNLMAVGGCAVATFALTVALFWPGALVAQDENQQAAAEIRRPILAVNGCELWLAGERAWAEGDMPVFKLMAVNKGTAEATVDWAATLSASSPREMMSRTLSLPKPLWQKSDRLVLAPGQSTTVTLATDAKLPRGSITVNLRSGGQGLTALRFAVGVEAAAVAMTKAARPAQASQPQ